VDTAYIDAVRLVHPLGYTHPHISEVRLLGGVVQSRAEVIHNIIYGKVRYVTYPPGGAPMADVIVGHCPHCGSGDYITTGPDTTADNNLLSLPRF
jgi:Protein of unknown function (DUF3892)